MRRLLLSLTPALALLAAGTAPAQPEALPGAPPIVPPAGALKTDGPEAKKFEDFDKVTKGAKEYDGLFKLYQKDENLYLELRPEQFNKPLLAPIAIARGMGLGGYTLNFEEQWVLLFQRVGDKVHLIRRNVRFRAKPGSAVAKAVEVTYTDSVLKALRIVTINPAKQAALINLNDVFLSDFAQIGLGSIDAGRSTWHKVKAFPKNIEIQVSAVFSGGRYFSSDDSTIDSRGPQLVIHYGLCELPDGGYQPRLADDRVGHFLSVVKDFSTDNKDTNFVRFVNRWRLEPAEPIDPKKPHRLVAPKKKIVFWIEKSVPEEYRAYVREGILEWNKAFEKVGFRDAIEVRQQENEDFDPEDITYSTFRWITTDGGFAMGPSRANPLTGEILDADIIFDASMVKYYKLEAKLFATGSAAEPASYVQASRYGYGLPRLPLAGADPRGAQGWNDRPGPVGVGPVDVRDRLRMIRNGYCQCASHRQLEVGFAAMAIAATAASKEGKEKAIDELVGQAIKETTMHEVGHTLGLRHNFKASTMLKNEQLHDTEVTRKQGLVGSVMDYNPVNLAPKGVKQGDYFTTTIGPYDYWAIEYAYKPLSGGTEGEVKELEKIATKCPQAGLDYGTDEDMMTPDPTVNVWDLGSDPMQYGKDRMAAAEAMMKDLAEQAVEKGEGYQRLRQAFSLLLSQYGNGAYLAANYVGGMYVRRDHRGDPQGRDPLAAVPPEKQREALKFLQERVLTDKPFRFPPDLLKKLAADRWLHWGNEYGFYSSVEYPLYSRILRIQRIALDQMFDAEVMARIQNNALQSSNGESALTLAEVFRAATDSVWADLVTKDAPPEGAVVRRNLQREHLKKLTTLVLGNKNRSDDYFYFVFSFGDRTVPPDARSLARLHLRELGQKIEAALKDGKADDARRAHLTECQERIAKVLGASMQVNDN